MTFEGSFTGKTFIEFLKRLIHNTDKPVFLIVDGHPMQKGQKVKEFVDSTNGQRHGWRWRKVVPDTGHPQRDAQVQAEFKKNSPKRWHKPPR